MPKSPTCPKCKKELYDVQDRNGRYLELCHCGYRLEVDKYEASRKFQCKKCNSMHKIRIDDDDRLAFRCFDCGYEETSFYKKELGVAETLFRDLERKGKPFYTEEATKKLLQPSKVVDADESTYDFLPPRVHCPRCNSTQISTGQRGYSIIWRFIGSGTTANRCANCGHKWRPRK